jgi:hypothetical protein
MRRCFSRCGIERWAEIPTETLSLERYCADREYCSKRPFLARGLGLEAYWLPVPRQEFVKAAGGMTIGHALQDV